MDQFKLLWSIINAFHIFFLLIFYNLVSYIISENNHGSIKIVRKTRDRQNIRYKRWIYTFLVEWNTGAGKHRWVRNTPKAWKRFRAGQAKETDWKIRNYRHERKRMFNHVECSERRRVVEHETPSLCFSRVDTARTPPPSEHTPTRFPEIILSRKRIFISKKIWTFQDIQSKNSKCIIETNIK